jgi:hypothetical protein
MDKISAQLEGLERVVRPAGTALIATLYSG